MRYTPFASVCTDCDSWLSRYSSTVQPASARSRESWTLSKLASYQADPFSTAETGVPGPPGDRMLPTAIETLALVVWVGLPVGHTCVHDHRAQRKAGIESGPELEHHDRARRERSVDCAVVDGDRRTGEADARRRTVYCAGQVHIGELAGSRSVEVVGNNDVVGRHRTAIHDVQEVFQLRAGEGRSTPDDGDLRRD